MDYKVFLKETKNIPKTGTSAWPWNTRTTPPWTAWPQKAKRMRDKILGGKAPGQQLTEKRAEIREIISSELLQEIILKSSNTRPRAGFPRFGPTQITWRQPPRLSTKRRRPEDKLSPQKPTKTKSS